MLKKLSGIFLCRFWVKRTIKRKERVMQGSKGTNRELEQTEKPLSEIRIKGKLES